MPSDVSLNNPNEERVYGYTFNSTLEAWMEMSLENFLDSQQEAPFV